MPETRSRARASSPSQPATTNPSSPPNGSVTHTNNTTHQPSPSPIRSPLYHPRYAPTGQASLASIAIQSLSLGILLGVSLSLTVYLLLSPSATFSTLRRVPLFLAACALFHFLEFYSTARWNSAQADRTSFLIVANGAAQGVAYAVALMEIAVRECGRRKGWWDGSWARFAWAGSEWVVGVGVLLIVVGQGARSLAMREAGASFNHLVQYYKKDDHVLVTNGIYRWVRHPSYFGFFYWALGTQLVLGNNISFFAYALALWRFFSHRVMHEERYLINFFGEDYHRYRSRTPTLIPFVG